MLKKLLLMMAGVFLTLPAIARDFSYEYEGQTLTYTVLDEEAKTCETKQGFMLFGFNTSINGELIIPDVAKDGEIEYTVTSIGKMSFSNCHDLRSVVLPYSVTLISDGAFHYCSHLESVNVPEKVSSIGISAFGNCQRLESIRIPNSVQSIGEGAFQDCCWLRSVIIPNSITSIGKNAFWGCYELEEIVYPETFSMEYLPSTIFQLRYDPETTVITEDGFVLGDYGSSLQYIPLVYRNQNRNIVIPEGITVIGSSSFGGGGDFDSILIPESIKLVDADAFKNCSIGRVNFNDWTKWCTNVKLGNLESNPYRNSEAYAGGIRMTSIILSEGMSEIPDYICCGLEGFKGEIELPSTLERIGAYAFYNNKSLASVIMPEGLREIGDFAFYGCDGMESVIIPKSVRFIGANAFGRCDGLKSIVVYNPETLIVSDAFSKNPNMYSNVLFFCPEGMDLSSVDFSSFDVQIIRFDPDNTTFLLDGTQLDGEGKTLFYAAVKDGVYTIPESVVRISKNAFRNVSEMKSLTIPSSVVEVEADAFSNVRIERVNFDDWDACYRNVKLGNFYANPYREGQAYYGGNKIKSIEIEDGLTEIGDYVHCGLDVKFKDVIELPSTLKRIGAYAFYNNKELYDVIMPEGLEEIGESAFEGCELLENAELPSSLLNIGDNAFRYCATLTEITLPEGLTSLGNGVFEKCSRLEKAVLVSDIVSLGDNLFRSCGVLNKVYFPLNLKDIGNFTFAACGALEEVALPATLESIGEYAFACGYGDLLNCERGSIGKLVIPNNVREIGRNSFAYNSISNLTIGSGLESIPENAFENNPLTVINFSDGLKEIGERAFAQGGDGMFDHDSYYGAVSSVNLPSTVSLIGRDAFRNVRITELVIPNNVTEIPVRSCGIPSLLTIGSGVKTIDANAFSFSDLRVLRVKANTPPSLSEAFNITTAQNDNLTLIVNAGRKDKYTTNARWKQINEIIEEGSSEVVIYMTGDYALSEEIRTTTGLMPASVTKMKVVGPLTSQDMRIIRENMVSLQSLDLSEVTNITSIPDNQFNGSLLTEIRLPSNLESIGEYAFADCSLLKVGEIPEGVKEIGDGAFMNCPRVEVSELPQSLVRLGNSAFANCPGIRNIAAGGDLEYLGGGAFSDCKLMETCDLGMTSLSEIEENTFSGCSSLDEVVLPESVKSIGSDAFSGTALRDIDFVAGVESIGESAFRGCRRLVTANIPENVTSVSGDILSSCNRLIAVSMSSKVTSVESGMFSGDNKLANISCAALEAPEAMSGAFDGIRERYVSLTVPTLSFRSYLNAPQWGRFQSIQNRIPVTIDPGVEVSNVTEEEYQEMLREDALEEAAELAAQESGAEPEQVVARRVARRSGVRRAAASRGAQFRETLRRGTDPDRLRRKGHARVHQSRGGCDSDFGAL